MSPEIYFAYLVHAGKRKLKLDWLFYQEIQKQYAILRKKSHIYDIYQKWHSFSVDKMQAFFETYKGK